MSFRDYKLFIEDILECIGNIEKYLLRINYEGFENNQLLIDAVVRNLEIIGEASKNIPDDIKNEFPSIPWKKIIGFRNIVIHEYFSVDVSNVWYISKEQLPGLKEILKQIMAK